MTDALLNDLKAALGEAYLIERELTGGGMSRVFVAREQALGREVVIKVLPPELAAGVNRERFRRELRQQQEQGRRGGAPDERRERMSPRERDQLRQQLRDARPDERRGRGRRRD